MTDALPPPDQDSGPAGDPGPDIETPWRLSRRERLMQWLGIGAAAMLALVLALGLAVRYGVLTETGRNLVSAPLEGLPLGPLGKLHVEGLTGDVWRDFRLKRLAIVDSQGVWLDARDVGVRWRSVELLKRRVHIESLTAASLQILRRPVLTQTKPGASSALPVSILVDRLQLRLQTLPAFSVQRGDFQLGARLIVERKGGVGGAIDLVSLLHSGDGLTARFDLGLHKKIKLDARVRKAGAEPCLAPWGSRRKSPSSWTPTPMETSATAGCGCAPCPAPSRSPRPTGSGATAAAA